MDIKNTNKTKGKTDFIFDLTPGKIIDLQLNTPVLARLKLVLVGYDVGNYIILKYPAISKPTEYADVLTVGNVAIVRYIVEGEKGECVAFSTTIKSIALVNEKLIFLEYPKQVENRQLRSIQRMQTHIPTQISVSSAKTTDTTINGVIVDISSEGCQFVFKSDSGNKQVKKVAIKVTINSPNGSTPTTIVALVRNSRYQGGKIFVGIQFEEKQKTKVQNLIDALALDVF